MHTVQRPRADLAFGVETQFRSTYTVSLNSRVENYYFYIFQPMPRLFSRYRSFSSFLFFSNGVDFEVPAMFEREKTG